MDRASTIVKCVFFATTALLLMTMLAFPMGNDQAIFEVCGALIVKKGAIPFRDFLEMKQPLIFYIYSLSTFLFGRHEWSIRLLDVLYHIVSLTIYYKIVRKVYKNEYIALVAILLYAVYFLSGGYWITAETESFALLPQLGILYFLISAFETTDKQQILGYAILAGACTILVISIKITLGLIAIPVILSIIFFSKRRPVGNSTFFMSFILSSVVFAIGEIYWLWASKGLQNLILTFQWFGNYTSNYSPLFGIATFKDTYYKLVPAQFLVTFTSSLLAVGIYAVAKHPISNKSEKTSSLSFFRFFCLLSIVFGILGVLLERKAYTYHYTRLTWCLVPFIAEGFFEIWKARHRSFELVKEWVGFRRVIALSSLFTFCAVFILWSPIPRIIDQSLGWSLIALKNDSAARAKKIESSKYDVVDAISLARKYASTLSSQENIFLWGNTAQLYYEFNKLPTTICIVNPQLISPWSPKEWIDTVVHQLTQTPPKYFFCELKDERPLVSGTEDDSYTALLKNSLLRDFLFVHYQLIDSNAHFRMYKNKSL